MNAVASAMSPAAESTDVSGAAIAFANAGWPVFPCRSNKSPLTPQGFKNATREIDMIRWWWLEKYPGAMIGVPTGRKTGVFVVDVNAPDGRTDAWCWDRLRFEFGLPIAKTRIVKTPNGAHIWFRMPPGCEIRNRGKLLDGAIDCIRGEGGYVIVPPSRRDDGKMYVWANKAVIAPAPQKLIELVRPPS